MSAWWSYILTSVGVLGLYLAGKKLWWAWLIGLWAQGLWVAYAVATEQWGFIASAIAYGWVYARNTRCWWRETHPAAASRAAHTAHQETTR